MDKEETKIVENIEKDLKIESNEDEEKSKTSRFKALSYIGSPISFRAKQIHQSLKRALRQYAETKDLNLGKDNELISPFIRKYAKLKRKANRKINPNTKIRRDLKKLDIALYNGVLI